MEQAIPKAKRKVVAVVGSYVGRFYLLVGLVPCYPVYRLLASFKPRFPYPPPPPSPLRIWAPCIRVARRSKLFLLPLRATWP